MLFDNIAYASSSTNFVLGLYNRGNYGTSHGWAAANSVAWNCDATGKEIIIQKPPTAQNYAIGCTGTVTGIRPPAPFAEAQGYIEGSNRAGLRPRSLYLAQLAERLGNIVPVHERNHGENRSGMFELNQNYPNPFNPSTRITFSLPDGGARDVVSLRVFDLLGRQVATLMDEPKVAGTYTVFFDASQLASGTYLYQLRSERFLNVKKMLVMK